MSTKDQSHKAVLKALAEDAPLTQAQRAILMGLVHDDEVWQRECERVARELAAVTKEKDRLFSQAESFKKGIERLERLLSHAVTENPGSSTLVMLMRESEAAEAKQRAAEAALAAVTAERDALRTNANQLLRSLASVTAEAEILRADAAIAASKEKSGAC